LTIDPLQFPGLAAQDFGALFPDTVLNTTRLEISGACTGDVVVINGPAAEIQVLEAFDAHGRHDDQSGLSMELPLVIETIDGAAGNCTQELLTEYFDTSALNHDVRALALVIRDSSGVPRIRWEISDFIPVSYLNGVQGRRFTFENSAAPNNATEIERDPITKPFATSFNPDTDFLIDVSGLGTFAAPVSVSSGRILTIELNWPEGSLWAWVVDAIQQGTSSAGKRDVALMTLNDAAIPIERVTYHDCFPKKFEQFAGFVQDIQLKERVILNCDYETPDY
jgi:hypothetical protein